MLAWAGRLLLPIAATCIAAGSGSAQTVPFSGEPSQTLKVAQSRPLSRAPTAAASGDGHAAAKANEWTLGLSTGQPEGSYLRVGGEIARNLNVQGKLRVIPMVTPGAVENIRDLLYLKGVDIALTTADVLDHFKTVEKIPNIEKRVHYVAELFIDDIHVLVRPEIRTYQDLERKKVSFHSRKRSLSFGQL
jgi:TRAP-type uncharacterized transport system substrate-binding protein